MLINASFEVKNQIELLANPYLAQSMTRKVSLIGNMIINRIIRPLLVVPAFVLMLMFHLFVILLDIVQVRLSLKFAFCILLF